MTRYLLFLICTLCMLLSSCMMKAPPFSYYYEPEVRQLRLDTYKQLIMLLPPDQRNLTAAKKEASWLAINGFKASISIARYNNPRGMGWQNNALVNSPKHLRERGLCWHYQADMFRELRRRHLEYFYLGCCQRDEGAAGEHNAIYIRAAHGHWPDAILMDPWPGSGRLTILNKQDILIEKWQDVPDMRRHLASVYTENHQYPLEHWERVQSDEDVGHYVSIFTPEGRNSRQGKIMFANMERGLKKRNGRLTDY